MLSDEAEILRELAREITREKKYLHWPENIRVAAERVVALHSGADALDQVAREAARPGKG